MDQAFLYFRSRHFSNRLACDNDEVNILNQLFLQFRECLADFSFDGIPHYGVADFFADGQPYPEMRLSFFIEHINHELAIRFGNTIMKYFLFFLCSLQIAKCLRQQYGIELHSWWLQLLQSNSV